MILAQVSITASTKRYTVYVNITNIMFLVEEESDPSVFVPSADALAALSEEEAALAGEGMVYHL